MSVSVKIQEMAKIRIETGSIFEYKSDFKPVLSHCIALSRRRKNITPTVVLADESKSSCCE